MFYDVVGFGLLRVTSRPNKGTKLRRKIADDFPDKLYYALYVLSWPYLCENITF